MDKSQNLSVFHDCVGAKGMPRRSQGWPKGLQNKEGLKLARREQEEQHEGKEGSPKMVYSSQHCVSLLLGASGALACPLSILPLITRIIVKQFRD